MKKIILIFLFLWCQQIFAEESTPQKFESRETLKNKIVAFVTQKIEQKNDETVNGDTIKVQVNDSDIPTNLAACSQEIETSLPNGTNPEQIHGVELSCQGNTTWRITIPVATQIYTKALVAKRMIPAHEIITEEDLTFASVDRNRLYNGSFKETSDAIGQTAAQHIPEGTVLTKRNIQLPIIIQRNQSIDLVARKNEIVVTMKGISKADGHLHDIIKAYNPSSKRILDAQVIGPNAAEVL